MHSFFDRWCTLLVACHLEPKIDGGEVLYGCTSNGSVTLVNAKVRRHYRNGANYHSNETNSLLSTLQYLAFCCPH